MIENVEKCPLVSIGIPLYKAKPFIPLITKNIESIGYQNCEFIFSDKHCFDDALDILRDLFKNDVRIRIYETRDQLDWIENYNFVFNKARGKYVMILQQDNMLPSGSLSAAVEILEKNDHVGIVCGPVKAIDPDGKTIHETKIITRQSSSSWTIGDKLSVFLGWKFGTSNYGLYRRSLLTTHGFNIPQTPLKTGLALKAMIFGLAHVGKIVESSNYITHQGVHEDSFTSKNLKKSVPQSIAEVYSYIIQCYRFLPSSYLSTLRWFWFVVLFISGSTLFPLRVIWNRTIRLTLRREK